MMKKKHHTFLPQQSTLYDVSGELLVQHYRRGIRLVKPGDGCGHGVPIQELYGKSYTCYFHDIDSRASSYNEANLIIFGSISKNDLLHKTPNKYADRNLSQVIIQNDKDVIQAGHLIVSEEAGKNLDGTHDICGISFKYPWYHNDDIIGVFGYSLILRPLEYVEDIHKIENVLRSTTLTNMSYDQCLLPGKSYNGIYFTKREAEVLRYTVQRYTAKDIASILSLSYRTIEHCLDRLKMKLDVVKKKDLIEKARLMMQLSIKR